MNRRAVAASAVVLTGILTWAACAPPSSGEVPPLRPPDYGEAFWTHWGDGQAEIATYDLTFPRYAEPREGSAVAILVTEPFSAGARVKSDRSAGADVVQALKLNLVKDFPTGVYDYNTMLSAFVALESRSGLAAGQPAKLSFSSQEWCGHVYHQALFDEAEVRHVVHSYFEGEADRTEALPRPAGGLAEDGLYLWARGLAAPLLEPGETRRVPLLLSLQRARLAHLPLAWHEATLHREAAPAVTTVPAGTFEVEIYRAVIEGGPSWFLQVEQAPPHRLVAWETSDGESARLVASERLPYWELHGRRDAAALGRIGLTPRPRRTP